jgi:hypothetical protein
LLPPPSFSQFLEQEHPDVGRQLTLLKDDLRDLKITQPLYAEYKVL